MIDPTKKTKENNEQEVRSFLRTFFHYGYYYWIKLWKGKPPGFILFFLGLFISIFMSFPILYVAWKSIFAGADRWQRLLDTRIPMLMYNSISLALAVTILAIILGVSLAWLVHRCDLPGRKTWQWALALPLVIPPYVGAFTYIIILGPRGWIRDIMEQFPFNIYSFWGIFFVLSMFTFPYVFLITSAALKKMNRNFEDVARAQGLGTSQIFWRVNFPFLRPAIGAGAILISLYVLSDFGAVAMLRYMTFTSAIYYQMGGYDNISATVLSMVLILLTLVILWIEGRTRKNQKYYQTTNTFRKPDTLKLGRFKLLALAYVNVVFLVSVLLPVAVLVYWCGYAVVEGVFDQRFWLYVINSLKVSGIAALICMFFALPIIYLKSRYPGILSTIIDKLSYSGYALPGVIVALGLIFIFNNYIPWLYNTFYLIAIAYVIRFLPLAMQSGESNLSLISPRIDEAARSLGYSPWKVLFKVIIPLVLPGIFAGGALVFVNSLKELPATLLLRPPGFDTLAVRVWVEASEFLYHLAAPAALLIIIASIFPLRWMLSKY